MHNSILLLTHINSIYSTTNTNRFLSQTSFDFNFCFKHYCNTLISLHFNFVVLTLKRNCCILILHICVHQHSGNYYQYSTSGVYKCRYPVFYAVVVWVFNYRLDSQVFNFVDLANSRNLQKLNARKSLMFYNTSALILNVCQQSTQKCIYSEILAEL